MLWNAHSGKLLHEETFECDIQGVAFSPDGKNLAIADDEAHESGLIQDVKTWKRKRTLQLSGLTSDLTHSPNGKYVASGGGEDEDGDEYPANLWNAETGNRLRTLSQSKGT